jgi:Zn-dependent peptidase ImmA (M78 family)/DNA-binding XRE family transcriptional regulator
VTLQRIEVTPEVIAWARTGIGLDEANASRKLGVSESTLASWEAGNLAPTIGQLRKMAKHYKRPLAVLLLPEPPDDFDAMRDFRSTGVGRDSRDWSPELHAEFRRAYMQREVFVELQEVAPGAVQPGDTPTRLDVADSAERSGDVLRGVLGIDPQEYWSDSNRSLNRWLEATEGLGFLVVQTSRVAVSEMRGFSISEWPFPVVALNGSDTTRGRLFTLAHELAHLLLNAGGLCDLHESRHPQGSEDTTERLCNAIAAAALMPKSVVLGVDAIRNATRDQQWTLDDLSRLSRPFGTSSESFLLRLISLQKATWDLYNALKPEIERQYQEARDRQREQRRERGGGPSFYVVKARNLGHQYVTSVTEALDSNAISSLDAADYLDVRFDQIPKLQDATR